MSLPCASVSRLRVSRNARMRPAALKPQLGGRACSTAQRQVLCQATAAPVDDLTETYLGETFYEILGVPPDAGDREIKMAYFRMMKECHPDLSQDDESTEFCKLLNDIYETLADPARRAMYNDLAGFSNYSVNPFLDQAHEKDLVFVDEFTCIGCRNCNNVCPKTFTMEEDWGRARVMRQRMDTDQKLQEAIDTCPVSCIHWVSAPQLTLLEATMARMERVAVWAMGNGNAANKDVFTEASLAWEKRFAVTRARRAAAAAVATAAAREAEWGGSPPSSQSQGGLGGLWEQLRRNTASFEGATASRAYEDAQRARGARAGGSSSASGQAEEGSAVGGKEAKSVAALAARAARASRSWKVYQDVVVRSRRGSALQLSSSEEE